MQNIVRKFEQWKDGKAPEWVYDDIFDFVDGELSRGEVVRMLEYLVTQVRGQEQR